jgi:hypothetical protein
MRVPGYDSRLWYWTCRLQLSDLVSYGELQTLQTFYRVSGSHRVTLRVLDIKSGSRNSDPKGSLFLDPTRKNPIIFLGSTWKARLSQWWGHLSINFC